MLTSRLTRCTAKLKAATGGAVAAGVAVAVVVAVE